MSQLSNNELKLYMYYNLIITIMKKNFLWSMLSMFLVVSVSVLFTACSDKKDDPSEIKANPGSVSFEANGGMTSIMVTSNTGWNVSGYPTWITVSPTSGSNNQQVSISAGKNEGTSSRSGMITFATSDGKASSTVQITQDGINPYYLPGTTWEENHRYSDKSTYTTSLSFSTSTAQLTFTYTEGTASTSDRIDYRYTQPGDGSIVVLTPVEAGKAVMEGKIENGAKMILTNTSNGAEVAVLYKK